MPVGTTGRYTRRVFGRLKSWMLGKLVRAALDVRADPARRAELRAAPLPDHWGLLVARELPQFGRLTPPQQARLLDDVKVFMGEKAFVGQDGFVVDDRAKVLVSATAALLVLGLDVARFDHVLTVEIRPTVIAHDDGTHRAGQYRHGEVGGVALGIVELVWDQVLAGLRHDDGDNVVMHELAHALDHGHGGLDALTAHPRYAAWQAALHRLPLRTSLAAAGELAHLVADVEGPELFAVATELFFERPGRLFRLDAELFEVMRAYYQLDPRTFA